MLLNQISGGDELTVALLNQLYKYAPIFNYLHFFKESGAGTTERYGDDIDGTFDNRPTGEDFGAQTLTPSYGTFSLKIIGKNIKLDTAFEERGGDVPSEFRLKLMNWAENAGRDLLSKLINDDSDDDDGETPATSLHHFDGLRSIIADQVTAGDSTRVISSGTNGLSVSLGNDNSARTAQQRFLEYLDELIASVDGGADCLMMDEGMLNRISAVARDQCQITLDQFGAKIGNYSGTPIVPTSRKYDGSRIIPYTETVGTSTDCTSIFAFKSAEKAHLTAMTTNSGFRVYPMQKIGNFYQVTPQLQMDMQPLSKRCVAKLAGIRKP